MSTVDELRDGSLSLRVLAGDEINTCTANGRLFFSIFVVLAEFERELIAEYPR